MSYCASNCAFFVVSRNLSRVLVSAESAIRKFVHFASAGRYNGAPCGSMGRPMPPHPVCAPTNRGRKDGQGGRFPTPTRTFLAVLARRPSPPFSPAVAGSGATATAPLDVPGLEQPASVVRDSLGIPHVFAQSDHDAYFLVGWLHAGQALPDGPEPAS